MNSKQSQFETAPGDLEPQRGTLIQVLSILSLALCGLFTGIIAWIMGKGDLIKIRGGTMDPRAILISPRLKLE